MLLMIRQWEQLMSKLIASPTVMQSLVRDYHVITIVQR